MATQVETINIVDNFKTRSVARIIVSSHESSERERTRTRTKTKTRTTTRKRTTTTTRT